MYLNVSQPLDKSLATIDFYTMQADKIGSLNYLLSMQNNLYRSQNEITSPNNPFVVMVIV